jgi:hypothetical protein
MNTAIVELIKRVYKSMDERELNIGLFLNLSKAFDLVDHDIFLKKMAGMAIRGAAQKWFQSYLENREQMWKLHTDVEKLMKLLTAYHKRDPLDMVCHRVLFLDQCYFCYRSTI